MTNYNVYEELTWVAEQLRRDIAVEVETALCRHVFEVAHNAYIRRGHRSPLEALHACALPIIRVIGTWVNCTSLGRTGVVAPQD